MQHEDSSCRRRRRGMAYVTSLFFLAAMASLAAALMATASLDVRQSANTRSVLRARLAAESGLSYMLDLLDDVRLPGSTTSETFPARLADALAGRLNGTPNLAGAWVSCSGTSVVVPAIDVGGKTFSCQLALVKDDRCRLVVTGRAGEAIRRVSFDYVLEARRPAVFDYGLASRGPITVFGNARIAGVNDPSEANVYSASTSTGAVIHVDGNAEVSGDLYTAREDAQVVVSGHPTVGGTSDPAEIVEHVHRGVGECDFPEVDTAPIAALATYALQPGNVSNKDVLTNVRIPAGTNPTFSSDVVLNGVVYVESPNVVKFSGKCTLNGLIVTEEKGDSVASCQLTFGGTMVAHGVEALPDTPEFEAVKQHTGTFIAAPGFGVTFAGNISAINGSIAADQLTFTGTAEGTVKGSVIGLKDLPTKVGGNVEIFVDRRDSSDDPAGFVKSFGFAPAPDSYDEPVGD